MWKTLIQFSCNRTRSSVHSHHLCYSFDRLGRFLWIFYRYLLMFPKYFYYYNKQCKSFELYPRFDLLNEFRFFISFIPPQSQWLYIIYYYHYQYCSSSLLFFIHIFLDILLIKLWQRWMIVLLSKESFYIIIFHCIIHLQHFQ